MNYKYHRNVLGEKNMWINIGMIVCEMASLSVFNQPFSFFFLWRFMSILYNNSQVHKNMRKL